MAPRLFVLLLALPSWAGAAFDYNQDVLPVLQTHCFQCHGEEKQKGDLRLDTLSSDLLTDRRAAERWHDVQEALQLGEMPPEDEPELGDQERRALLGWISQELDKAVDAQRNTSGRPTVRRLNRVEYQNTMIELLGIETDYTKNFPPEALSHDGFQNNGATLQMSDLQLGFYLEAAREGLRKAIVTGERPETFQHTITKSVKDKGPIKLNL